jgi:hypothetical protein
MVIMGMNTESRISRKSLLLTSLLVVVLVSSLFVCVFVLNGSSGASLENVVHVKNEDELKNAINNAPTGGSTTIALDNDISLISYEEPDYTYNYQIATLIIPANKDITLTSNRSNGYYKLIGAVDIATILVGGGGTLRLDGVVVTHKSGVTGCGVYVLSMHDDGGVLYLYSGEISGNTINIPFTGGGVINTGTFIMSGGKITSNTAGKNGGGVYNGGTFKMIEGEISGNTAGSCGGGVSNGYYSSFTMSGGTISDNTANVGGGVHLDIFSENTIMGGEISGNTAFKQGGGVFNSGARLFVMSGGTVSGNSAEEGGGVYHGGDVFTMSGGKITSNTAAFGGGVYVYNNYAFNRKGGVISDNTATNKCNDVYPDDNDNSSSNNGGGSSTGNGGSANGNGNGSGDTGEGLSNGGGFGLRDIVFIGVGVALVVVGVVVAVLLFTFKKELKYTKEKSI